METSSPSQKPGAGSVVATVSVPATLGVISMRTSSFGWPAATSGDHRDEEQGVVHARRDRSPGGGTIGASVPSCHGRPRSRYVPVVSVRRRRGRPRSRGGRDGSRRTRRASRGARRASDELSVRRWGRPTVRRRRPAPRSNGLPTTPRRWRAASSIARSKRSRALSRLPVATWARPPKCVAKPMTAVPRPTVMVRSPNSSSRGRTIDLSPSRRASRRPRRRGRRTARTSRRPAPAERCRSAAPRHRVVRQREHGVPHARSEFLRAQTDEVSEQADLVAFEQHQELLHGRRASPC